MDVRYYVTKSGKDVVDDWIAGLADHRAEARIFAGLKDSRVEILETTSPWVEGCLNCALTSARATESIAR